MDINPSKLNQLKSLDEQTRLVKERVQKLRELDKIVDLAEHLNVVIHEVNSPIFNAVMADIDDLFYTLIHFVDEVLNDLEETRQ